MGYLNIRLHRQHLEAATLTSAERVSDVIKRSTTYYMLRNDREGMYHAIATMADEPGMVRVRIFDQEGRISYSSDTAEVSHVVDKSAEACYGCHAQSQPLARLNRPDRFRIYRDGKGQRSAGHYHAHRKPAGLLQRRLPCASCEPADPGRAGYESLARQNRRPTGAEQPQDAGLHAGRAAGISLLSWLFVWRLVGQPIKHLKNGTKELADGNLGYQLEVRLHGRGWRAGHFVQPYESAIARRQ